MVGWLDICAAVWLNSGCQAGFLVWWLSVLTCCLLAGVLAILPNEKLSGWLALWLIGRLACFGWLTLWLAFSVGGWLFFP